jgi:hypothetical protein
MMRTSPAPLSDADIRPALRARLLATNANECDALILDELGICRGQVRVDMALVNGHIHGYEIKSDRDSLRRLSGQIALYSKVLDRATLVIGARHMAEALSMLPPWWGVIRVDAIKHGLRFRTVRRGKKNPARDPRALVELLWRDDAIAMLQERKLDKGIRGKPRRLVWDRVCEHFHVNDISAAVRENLKARSATPIR